MIEGILAAIVSILKAIPLLDKWFTKTEQEQLDDAKKLVEEEKRRFEKIGRPQ